MGAPGDMEVPADMEALALMGAPAPGAASARTREVTPESQPDHMSSASARAAFVPSGTLRPMSESRDAPDRLADVRRPSVMRALARCPRAIPAKACDTTSRAGRSDTRTATVCIACRPPGSDAATATAATP